jgi:hypothetical protein
VIRNILVSAPALAALLAVHPAAASGQVWERWSLEVGGSQFVSGQPTLERGNAVDLRLLIRLQNPDWLTVGVTVVQMWSGSNRDGEACRVFRPRKTGCALDRLEEYVRLRRFGVAGFGEVGLTWSLRARAGGGVSISELHATSEGMTTGEPGDLYAPTSAHLGGFLEGVLLWTPLDRLPLDLVVGGAGHVIWFDGCRGGTEYFTPYCGPSGLSELRVGLAYRPGR